jgi:hypothetical protein
MLQGILLFSAGLLIGIFAGLFLAFYVVNKVVIITKDKIDDPSDYIS